MSHQIRPGVRGGRDQFSWDQVKEDKQRSNYLGSSIHGVPDKFKKGPETFWYAKEKAVEAKPLEASEIESIKAKEKQMMEALLGGGQVKKHVHQIEKPIDRVYEKRDEQRRDDSRNREHGYKNDRYGREHRREDRKERRTERFESANYRDDRDRTYQSRDSHPSHDTRYRREYRDYQVRSPNKRNRSRSRSPNMYK